MEKNKKLNLQDIIDMVAFKQKITKEEAEIFVREFFSLIQKSLSEDNPVKIKDFGTFKLTLIQARESVNVNTGEKIEIPAHYRFSFSPATTLKELVNKPFANFETTLLHNEFHNENISIANENEEENEENDIVFVVEKTEVAQHEETQYEKENEVVVEKNKTVESKTEILETNEQFFSEKEAQMIEQRLPKQPFVTLLGVAVVAVAIVAVGLLLRKK